MKARVPFEGGKDAYLAINTPWTTVLRYMLPHTSSGPACLFCADAEAALDAPGVLACACTYTCASAGRRVV